MSGMSERKILTASQVHPEDLAKIPRVETLSSPAVSRPPSQPAPSALHPHICRLARKKARPDLWGRASPSQHFIICDRNDESPRPWASGPIHLHPVFVSHDACARCPASTDVNKQSLIHSRPVVCCTCIATTAFLPLLV